MKSRIHLIRHGNTEGTLNKWHYGAMDIPLHQSGRQELAELRELGIYPDCSGAEIYTSGMKRTEETLEVIYGQLPHKTFDALQEFNFGSFEGRTYEELLSDQDYIKFIEDTSGEIQAPGGESVQEFRLRIRTNWNRLVGLHRLTELSHRHSGLPADTIFVCHGGVIGVIMLTCFGRAPGTAGNEPSSMYPWIPKPGHGYTIIMEEGEPREYIKF